MSNARSIAEFGSLAANNGLIAIRQSDLQSGKGAVSSLAKAYRRFLGAGVSNKLAKRFKKLPVYRETVAADNSEVAAVNNPSADAETVTPDIVDEATRAWAQVFGAAPVLNDLIIARRMLDGELVVANDPSEQAPATALAAAMAAKSGVTPHIVFYDDTAAKKFERDYAGYWRALDLTYSLRQPKRSVDVVTAEYRCNIVMGTFAQIARDYMADELYKLRTSSPLQCAVQYLRQGGERRPGAIMRGLRLCLLVDADKIVMENATKLYPALHTAITGEEYEMAIEALTIADRLTPERDYRVSENEAWPELTDAGRRRLEAECEHRRGFWADEERSLSIIRAALSAQTVMQEGADYQFDGANLLPLSERCAELMAANELAIDFMSLICAKHKSGVARQFSEERSGYSILASYLRLGAVMPPAFAASSMLQSVFDLPSVSAPSRRQSASVKFAWVEQGGSPAAVLKRCVASFGGDDHAVLVVHSQPSPTPGDASDRALSRVLAEEADVAEVDMTNENTASDGIVAQVRAGRFQTVVFSGLNHSGAAGRLIGALTRTGALDVNLIMLIDRNDALIKASFFNSFLASVEFCASKWPNGAQLLSGSMARYALHREKRAWRQYCEALDQRSTLMSNKLAFSGR